MDETVGPTYTNSPAAERFRLAEEAARRNTGFVNPESVRQALATQTLENDPALQQSFSQQESALSAMDELAKFDREIAAKQISGNQQMTQNIRAAQQRERAMGSFDPNNPSATIAQGPATFDTQQILRDATPTSLISPFAANSIVSGQQNMNVDTFNMAGDAASARQRNLGFEIAALARAYAQQYEEDQKRKQLLEAQKQQQFENAMALSKLTGQPFVDPYTGKSYDLPKGSSYGDLSVSEREQQRVFEQMRQDIANRMTPADLFTKYAGVVGFNDIMTEYNAASPWGPAKESLEELRAMYDAGGASSIMPGDRALQEVMNQGGARLLTGSSLAERTAQAQAIMQMGGVDAYRRKLDLPDLLTDKELAADQAMTDLAAQVQAALGKFANQEGPGGTGLIAGLVPYSFSGERAKSLRRALSGISSEKIKELSGAAVSEQEAARLEGFLPTKWKSETDNYNDLLRLYNGIAINRELFELAKRNNLTPTQALYQYGPEVFAKYGETYPYGSDGRPMPGPSPKTEDAPYDPDAVLDRYNY